MFCFNCKREANHRSEHCLEPQQYNRCASCSKVAFYPAGHLSECRHKTFVSTSVFASKTVFDIKSLAIVDFLDVDGIYIRDSNQEIEILFDTKWLSTIDAFVKKVGVRSIEFKSSRPMKRNVTIVNKDGKPVVSLVFLTKLLIVNNRYEINDKGQITYNCAAESLVERPITCIMVKNTENVFKMRVHWYGFKHAFLVHPDVVTIKDPLMRNRENSLTDNNANEVEENAVALPMKNRQVRVGNDRQFTVTLNLGGNALRFALDPTYVTIPFQPTSTTDEENRLSKRQN